jgi:hypothetical protein
MNSFPYQEGQHPFEGQQAPFEGQHAYQNQQPFKNQQHAYKEQQYPLDNQTQLPYTTHPQQAYIGQPRYASDEVEQPHNIEIQVQPPDATYSRGVSKDEPRPGNFNFEFQERRSIQQDPQTPRVRPSPQPYRFDSRTNSEIYPESLATTLQYDSRYGSEANLLYSRGSGVGTPSWNSSSNLVRAHGDLRDYRSPSPNVSALKENREFRSFHTERRKTTRSATKRKVINHSLLSKLAKGRINNKTE